MSIKSVISKFENILNKETEESSIKEFIKATFSNEECMAELEKALSTITISNDKKEIKTKTAYQYFVSEIKDQVKKDNPDLKGKDLIKEIARLWKEDYAGDNVRKKWKDMSDADKAEKGVEKKKRTKNSYQFFLAEMKEELKKDCPELKGLELISEVARLWKEDYSDEKSRKRWKEMAEQAKKDSSSSEDDSGKKTKTLVKKIKTEDISPEDISPEKIRTELITIIINTYDSKSITKSAVQNFIKKNKNEFDTLISSIETDCKDIKNFKKICGTYLFETEKIVKSLTKQFGNF